MRKYLLTVCIATLLAGSAWAQDEQVDDVVVGAIELSVDAVQDGQGTFSQMRVISSDGEGPQTFFMAGGDPFSGGAPMSFSFGNGPVDSFSMLSNPSVQKDLELVEDQIKQIQDIQREFGQRIKEQLKGGISGDKAKQLGEIIRQLKDEQKEQINGILLKHQQDRLQQVALQTQLKNSGTANALGSKNFADALGLTDDQVKRLKERATELKKAMDEKIARMKEEMKAELLEELTAEQQSKLKDMLGDEYKSNSEDWNSSIRNRIRRRGNSNDGD